MGKKYTSVEEYLDSFTGETRERLDVLRAKVFEIMPNATERISYNIPAYFVDGTMVVYFSGYAHHVSFYPLHLIDPKNAGKFSAYASGKATLKLPNAEPLPMKLIEEFIKLRLESVRQESK